MRGALAAILILLVAGHAQAAAPARPLQVLFVEKRAEFLAEGALEPGASKTFRFTIAQANVTRVEFVLQPGAAPEGGEPAVFTLTANGPGGWVVAPPARSRGEVKVSSPALHDLPAPIHVEPDDLERILVQMASGEGRGEWTASVHADALRPAGSPAPFRIGAFLHYYEAVPMQVVSLEGARGSEWADDARPWVVAFGILTIVAVLLAVWLVREASLRRRSRVSLRGDNIAPHER